MQGNAMTYVPLVLYMLVVSTVNGLNTSCANCACCFENKCAIEGFSFTCTYGCTEGHWGDDCSSDCLDPGCLRCSMSTGRCSICKNGYGGSSCDITCPPGCVTCYSATNCRTCKDGYYRGRYNDISYLDYKYDCSLPCRDNCTTCSYYNSCYGCKSGTYGTYCDRQCPPTCFNSTCGKSTGLCSDGCATGYTGDRCEQCVPGRYGTECNKNCSSGCIAKQCDRGGACTSGCYDGYKGRTCTKVDSEDNKDAKNVEVALGIGSASGVLVGMVIGGICVVIVVICIRKRRHNSSESKQKCKGKTNTGMAVVSMGVANGCYNEQQEDYENVDVILPAKFQKI